MQETANAVWVPNRNGLFINIAASFADKIGDVDIVFGANKEEGATFKDNSLEFVKRINRTLKYSVNSKVKVYAPLIDMSKEDIVKLGIELNIPFKKIYSCYNGKRSHCGFCESCLRLKQALKFNDRVDILQDIFEE